MLTARAITDINEQKSCCEVCGMTHDADLLYYAIFENDSDCLGTCAFRFCKDKAVIVDIEPKCNTYDKEAMFILGKATLNFIDLVNFKAVEYTAKDMELAALLEFYEKNGIIILIVSDDYEQATAKLKELGAKAVK